MSYPVDRIVQSWENADPTWRDLALQTVVAVCFAEDEFTVDQVWAELDQHPAKTQDRRAIGGVLHRATQLGYCKPSGEKHTGKAVYLSLLRF
jgi:hypothetical protein